jgi:hypothetical protein
VFVLVDLDKTIFFWSGFVFAHGLVKVLPCWYVVFFSFLFLLCFCFLHGKGVVKEPCHK